MKDNSRIIDSKQDVVTGRIKSKDFKVKKENQLVKDRTEMVKRKSTTIINVGTRGIAKTAKSEEHQENVTVNRNLVPNTSAYYRRMQQRKIEKTKKLASQNGSNKLGIKAGKKDADFGAVVKPQTGNDYKSKVICNNVKYPQNKLKINRSKAKFQLSGASKRLGIKTIGGKVGAKSAAVVTKKTVATTTTALAKKVILSVGVKMMAGIKAIAGVILAKFAIPVAVVLLVVMIIIVIIMMMVGVAGQMSSFIPIEEEVLVTQLHTHITRLDLETESDIKTDTKDLISLVFMLGAVQPERTSNEPIFELVTDIHRQIHESGYGNLPAFLTSNSNVFGGTFVDDFSEFRRFAFIQFYDTLGNPYENDNWRDYITSHFGYRNDPFDGGHHEFHNGLDIGKLGGTPILATISGRVQFTGYDADGYGYWVMIYDRETGKETRYAHLRRIDVRTGQQVNRGDVVGLTGTTGNSTGDHLHHEFRRNGNLLNSYFYFPPADSELLDLLD